MTWPTEDELEDLMRKRDATDEWKREHFQQVPPPERCECKCHEQPNRRHIVPCCDEPPLIDKWDHLDRVDRAPDPDIEGL